MTDIKNNDTNKNTDYIGEIHISKCVTHANVIKFFVQLFFSFVIVIFCMIMILRSSEPSKETLWISLLTSTITTYLPSPGLNKK